MGQTHAIPRAASLRGRVGAIRTTAGTTPGYLRTLAALIAAGAFLLGLLALGTLAVTGATVDTIGRRTAPSVIDAQKIHAALADADRSAANSFLAASVGDEPRQRYQRDVATATRDLEQAAEHNSAGSRASRELQTIIVMVTDYTSLVETARAGSRDGFPIGAAYLRAASDLIHRRPDGILARVDTLDDLNAQDLTSQEASLWLAVGTLGALLAVGVAVVVILLRTQAYLRRKFRRRRNSRLLAATAIAVLVPGAVAAEAANTYRSLTVAEQQAFDHLHNLWQVRSLVDDANGNESLSLVARGNGAAFDAAFKAETAQLADRPLSFAMVTEAAAGHVTFRGLLADEVASATFPGEREAAIGALRAYQAFLAADIGVRARVAAGDRDGAVARALGSGPGQLGAAFASLDAALGHAIDIDQRQFDTAIATAIPLLPVEIAVAPAAAAIALLALWGLWPRMAEYVR